MRFWGVKNFLLIYLAFNALLVPACTKQNFTQLYCLSSPHSAMTTKAAGGYLDVAEPPLACDLCSIETLGFAGFENTMKIYDVT